MVYEPRISKTKLSPDGAALDAKPPMGPELHTRAEYARGERSELRWWIVVLLAAIVLSLLALAAVR